MTRTTIDVESLREMLERGDPVTVLDVRPGDQWAEWRIPGSVHVDAYGALKAKDAKALEGADLPEGQPVVTVCAAGSSAVAAEQLRERGYEALTLEGGMRSWSLAWNTAEVSVAEAKVIQVRRTGIAAPLSEVRQSVPLLGEDEEALVRRIIGRVSPGPENHERIVELNMAGELPKGDPTKLEAARTAAQWATVR